MRNLPSPDQLQSSLPADFPVEFIFSLGKPEWLTNKPRLACLYGLRKCIDWQAYLTRYPDVAAAGIDPVLHFLDFGVYEGRSLAILPAFSEAVKLDRRPRVSVILSNYNCAAYLPQSLGSLIKQTLPDIEIIVVDDCSTDASLETIRRIAASDQRVRVIRHRVNSSLHMTRKTGVAAASGEYVMFLDADDYYEQNACEIACKAISEGYDIVNFGINLIWQTQASAKERSADDRWYNRAAGETRFGSEIEKSMFVDETVSTAVWGKIYKAELAKNVFASLQDGHYYGGEDKYEMLALAHEAQSLLMIGDRLYNYRMGTGISTGKDPEKAVRLRESCAHIATLVKKFCSENGIEACGEKLMESFLGFSVRVLIDSCPPARIISYFEKLADAYGIAPLVERMQREYGGRVEIAARKMRHYLPIRLPKKVSHIGIYLSSYGYGGTESVIGTLIEEMLLEGFKITLFLRVSDSANLDIDPRINVVYLSQDSTRWQPGSHYAQMIRYISELSIDLFMAHDTGEKYLFWQSILLKYLGIPQIVFYHGCFERNIFLNRPQDNLPALLASMQCYDKVVCLSRYAELFLRINGIDAQYIPDPVRIPSGNLAREFARVSRNIVYVGRLGDEKKLPGDCLLILKEVLKDIPDVTLTFVGDFYEKGQADKFRQRIRELGLAGHIAITGWTKNVNYYLDEAAVFLSTSWSESFGMGMAEALARGTPVVMYDLPVELARDNEAAISVPQGDIGAAAKEIVNLLNEPVRWTRLSRIARESVKQFSSRTCMAKLRECMAAVRKQSVLTNYSREDYKVLTRALVYYGAHKPAWQGA